jgi:two-component system chemotaxis response regulator CheB
VVLSGALDDGTAGLAAIKRRGGVAMVQDPDQAAFPGMPASALAQVAIDHCGTVEALAALLARLVREPAAPMQIDDAEAPNLPSMLTCPECTGSLWETDDHGVLRYRCHVGHRFTSDTLLAGQHETRERALWAAIRALEEQAMLSRRIAERARGRGHPASADRFEKMAALHADQASQIRMIAAEQPRALGVP